MNSPTVVNRARFEVRYRGRKLKGVTSGGWLLTAKLVCGDLVGGSGHAVPIAIYRTKTVAVATGKALAHSAATDVALNGFGAQLVIHKRNGRIQSERTYPDVTPRRRG